jgi:hypothetical protein
MYRIHSKTKRMPNVGGELESRMHDMGAEKEPASRKPLRDNHFTSYVRIRICHDF